MKIKFFSLIAALVVATVPYSPVLAEQSFILQQTEAGQKIFELAPESLYIETAWRLRPSLYLRKM